MLLYKLIFVLLNVLAQKELVRNIEEINDMIYDELRIVAEDDYFSKIRMTFGNECPRSVKRCSAIECKVKEMSFYGEGGIIDLLKYPESYSPEAYKSGPDVWSDIKKIINDDELLEKIVSGLRHSINTHIALFYHRKKGKMGDLKFRRNLWIYKNKFENEEYEQNFWFVYNFVTKGIESLMNNQGVIPDKVMKLSQQINRIKDKYKNKEEEQHLNNENEIKAGQNEIKKIDNMIRSLACLGCQKCLLWGTIQLRGLKAVIKALNGIPLTKIDVICMINGYRRLSVTAKETRQIKNATMTLRDYLDNPRFKLISLYISAVLLSTAFVVRYRRIACKKIFVELVSKKVDANKIK